MKNGTIEMQPFEVSVPEVSGEGIERLITIQIPMEWDAEIGEWLMTEEGSRLVEETKCRAMGLLTPGEMKALRERLGFSQKQMGELFQVGAKSWTRWETGRYRPMRVIGLLIRALHDGAVSLDYLLERAGMKESPSPWMKVVPAPKLVTCYFISSAQPARFVQPQSDSCSQIRWGKMRSPRSAIRPFPRRSLAPQTEEVTAA
jgi:DNA-binding transcriptional regulator YiaG